MRSKKSLAWLVGLSLLLTGCAAQPQAAGTPTQTPPVVEAPEIAAQGALADAARRRMAPYEAQLNRIAPQCGNNLTYTIPGDLIAKMAGDAATLGVSPADGRYRFTWTQSGQHAYQATGLEVQEAMDAEGTHSPSDPAEEAPMDDQKMGDFSAAGGGLFERSYAYDVAEDLSGGAAEIIETLNGETTGHELFSFAVREGALYFVDAAMDLTASLDVLESRGTYLVAVGILRENQADIVEYHVTDEGVIPDAATLDWAQLIASITPLSTLTARGDAVQVTR